MRVQCLRDNTTFDAIAIAYPSERRPTTEMCERGDRYIECPTCARRYFFHDKTGKWSSDRDLKIIRGDDVENQPR
jgi:hypothetical protein